MNLSIRRIVYAALIVSGMLLTLHSCKHDSGVAQEPALDGGYPTEVNNIIMLHCTTGPTGGGCHNSIGATNAGGLRMDTWDKLFDGSIHGATVIPYDTVNSPLLHFINTDSTIGPVALPMMPYTGSLYSTTPLNRDEYDIIKKWIASGAPDKHGNIPFGTNAGTRQKIFITQQGSDMLSVVDAARHVVMRNIPLGMKNTIESPHCVRVSKDGLYAYVSFQAGDYLQKIETATDRVVDQVQLSSGDAAWNLLHISDDGSKIIVADFLYGKLKLIQTSNMNVIQTIPSNIPNPHGIAATPAFDTIFVTAQYGNSIYKLYPDGNYKIVTVDGAPSTFSPLVRDPHEIMMTPAGDKYFVTCEFSNEVRVLNTRTDAILAAIPVPAKPQEIAVSRSYPYMLVTCMEATSPVTGAKGAVVVIDYNTMKVIKTIWGDFWQPHGIAIDDPAGTFYVASTNQTGASSGHNHSSGGKHGWYNVYSLATFDPVISRDYETLVLPYSADSRIKP